MARTKQEKTDFETALYELEKKYGMNKVSPKELEVVSTGSLQLNQAMEIGGTPLGKMIELYGPMSSGKTTLTLHQMAEYQKAFPDKRVALFDYENSFNLTYAKEIGVDIDKLLIYQPDHQEMGYDMIISLIQGDLVSCIVIDSQTAAAPKAVVDGEMGDSTIALQARNNSKFCMKVKGLLTIHKVTLFIISQTRDNIGGYGADASITSGGHALKFYSDVRWKFWKQNDKVNEQNKTTIEVSKSKVGRPFRQAKFNICYGDKKGIDTMGEILDYAIEFKILTKSGAWYSYNDSKNIAQGETSMRRLLEDNPELLNEITNKVINTLKGASVENIEEVVNEE